MDYPVLSLREHGIFAAIQKLEDLIDATRIIAEEVSLECAELHGRVRHHLAFIRKRLRAADPILAPEEQLNALLSYLNRVQLELENFRSTQSVSHLSEAISHAGRAVGQVLWIPTVADEADVQAVQEAVVSFRRSWGQHLRHLEEQIGATNSEIQTLRSQVTSLAEEAHQIKPRIDETIRRFEAQFSQGESDRRRETQSFLSETQARISEVEHRFHRLHSEIEQRLQSVLSESEGRMLRMMTDLEQRFQNAQDSRNTKFEQQISELRSRSENLLKEVQDERTQRIATLDAEFDAYRTELANRMTEVENIVGAIAQTGMVGGYQRVANYEKRAMWAWQVITVLSMLAFVYLMLKTIPSGETAIFSLPVFLGRTMAALGFAALAAYAGREGAKHGEKERVLRQLELEIASVGPFLATIPKEDQDAIKKTIADRVFGRGVQPLVVDDPNATTSGLVEVIRYVLTELLKRSK